MLVFRSYLFFCRVLLKGIAVFTAWLKKGFKKCLFVGFFLSYEHFVITNIRILVMLMLFLYYHFCQYIMEAFIINGNIRPPTYEFNNMRVNNR